MKDLEDISDHSSEPSFPAENMRRYYARVNGVRLHVTEAGPAGGAVLLLLHGFPDFWYGWREQIRFFTRRGFRVIAPDQRGYNLSDKPPGIDSYHLDALALDIKELLLKRGVKKCVVIGHDWGGMVAWHLATRYPELLAGQIVVNVPHPLAMKEAIRSRVSQKMKSWYVYFFLIPWLPEKLLALRNWRLLTNSRSRASLPGIFQENPALYHEAWSRPGAFQAMLNWYRCVIQREIEYPENLRLSVPTRILWGVGNETIELTAAERSLEFCEKGRLDLIEGAGHWAQQEKIGEVNALMLDFIQNETELS